MARQPRPASAGRIVDEDEGPEEIQVNSGASSDDRQDGGKRDRAITEPVRIWNPSVEKLPDSTRIKPAISLDALPDDSQWPHYEQSIVSFESQLLRSRQPGVGQLRIIEVTVPLKICPPFHQSPIAGYGIVKGDSFTIRLSNNYVVEAK